MGTKIRLVKGQPDHDYPEGVEPVRGEDGKAVPLAAGVAIEVDDGLAGKPPSGTPGNKTYDPGSGLLAQTDKWEPAPKSASPVTSDEKGDN